MFTYQRKFFFPLRMDLQLFAGEQSATVDGQTFEIDDSDDGFTEDDDDVLDDINVDDDAGDEDDGTAESDSTTDDNDGAEGGSDVSNAAGDDGKADTDGSKGAAKDNPAARAAIAERKKYQERLNEANKRASVADKLMKMLGIENLEDLQARLDGVEAAKIAKDTGITPEQAQSQLRQQRQLEEQSREIRNLKYSQEVSALKADPFFADIEDYRDEYQEIAERTGLSMKQVYMAQRGETRMKEYEREVEQRTLANRDKRQKAKVDTAANGEQVQKPKHNLSPDQLSMAKAAVRMGTFKSVEEYAKFLKK